MTEKLLKTKIVFDFLAEAGDISRFNNPKELQELSRLILIENSFGKYKDKTTISRHARKKL